MIDDQRFLNEFQSLAPALDRRQPSQVSDRRDLVGSHVVVNYSGNKTAARLRLLPYSSKRSAIIFDDEY